MSTRSWRSKVQTAAVLLALAPMALVASTAIAQNADDPGASATASAQTPKPAKKRKAAPPAPTLSGTPTEIEAVGPAANSSVAMPAMPTPAKRGRRNVEPELRQVVSSPGFQMLPSGGSRIEVSVMGKPKVLQYLTPGALVYVFQNARVPVNNNRNPLVTHFFNTPVAGTRLRQVGQDVHLIVDLRSQATPQARVIELVPNRVLALQIDFAPGDYWNEPVLDPQRGTRRMRGAQDQPARSGRSTDRAPTRSGQDSVLGPPAP